MGVSVLRGGVTSRTWSGSGSEGTIGYLSGWGTTAPLVTLSFQMPSKGGGETQVLVQIDPESFERLATCMLNASKEDAIRAFGAALQLV